MTPEHVTLRIHGARLTGTDTHGAPLDLPRATLLAHEGRIVWMGSDEQAPAVDAAHSVDAAGRLVTPGLIDCHTHLVYGGDRAHEFALRLGGASYETLARAGGGIRSTVEATRRASDDALLASALGRARALLAGGVTTLEIKSCYGLSFDHERRCLQVARHVARATPLTVHATCLAAHTLPPERAERPDDYIADVVRWIPRLHAEGLVDSVDAFCESIAFSTAQTRRVFEAARACGLPVRLHAEQLSNQHGAELAASFGALSCDHLEHLDAAGVEAMARAGTVAVLLPGAFFVLRETRRPPVDALRRAGVPLAVATDHNPGTSPTLSLVLMMQMACTLFGLTPAEALAGATTHAARALALDDRGRLGTGLRADLALWDAPSLDHLLYELGAPRAARVFVAGAEVAP